MLKANRIAIAGATGMVGQAFLKLLEKDFYPNAEIVLLASKKSKGKSLAFRGTELIVQDLAEYDFSSTDLALFSAGASVSSQFAPKQFHKDAWLLIILRALGIKKTSH